MSTDEQGPEVCTACSDMYGTCELDAAHPGSHETHINNGNMIVRWLR